MESPLYRIVLGDNLEILKTLPSSSVDLVYVDPPFNTGKKQSRKRITVVPDDAGDRTGFEGKRYRTVAGTETGYEDSFENFLEFLRSRIEEARRLLKPNGSFFFHIDYREVHYCKVMLDEIFGRENFINEIIWSYDYGARSRRKWSAKHDNILWYAMDPDNYTFNYDAIDRIPYMAPNLVGPEKAALGKTPTDVWWHTIVPTNSKEKTGYATQKPLGILRRIIRVHSNPGDLVLDFFAGSGTTGMAAAENNRGFILIDSNPDAVTVMKKRLEFFQPLASG